ncbi:MAG: hypothetical protein ACI8PZ_000126 [Myxococcota bacterium]|jgi:hypothetical protein
MRRMTVVGALGLFLTLGCTGIVEGVGGTEEEAEETEDVEEDEEEEEEEDDEDDQDEDDEEEGEGEEDDRARQPRRGNGAQPGGGRTRQPAPNERRTRH